MSSYNTEDIIEGIAKRKERVIKYVYDTCYEDIRKLILMNNGSDEDVKDTMQEAMYIIYQKVTQQGLSLHCQFKTYLYSVCRFLWLKELEKKALDSGNSVFDDENYTSPPVSGKYTAIKLNIFEKHYKELSKECKKVLRMYFKNVGMAEICKVMGYKNIQIAKDKKYKCKKSLMTKIYNNPDYQKVKDEIHLAG